MIKFKDWFILLENRLVMEMANLQTIETGLVSIVFVSTRGKAKHGPRIKVSNIAGRMHPDDNFTVTVDPNPRVIGKCKLKNSQLDDIIDWVILNRTHLEKIWREGDTMTGQELYGGFTKL